MTIDQRSCDGFDPDLSAWIDGELTPARAGALRTHLETCERCSARVMQLRAVDTALEALPAAVPAADLRARLQQEIEASEREARPAWRRRRGVAAPRHVRLLAWRAAAAAAVAALAVLVLRPGPEQAPRAPGGAPAPLAATAPDAPRATPSAAPDVPAEAPPMLAAQRPVEPPASTRAAAPGRADAIRTPAAATPASAASGADDVSLEDLELALDLEQDDLEIESVEDLEVIANLELLEALVALDEGTG